MQRFRILQLSDRLWVQKALRQSDYRGCEYSFANNLAWRRAADTRCMSLDELYICVSLDTEDSIPVFYYPAGKGDIKYAVSELGRIAASLNVPLVIAGAEEDKVNTLRLLYGDSFEAVPYEDGFDYIYNTSDIINLAGKKYHKKRNHLAQFEKLYPDYSFREIRESDFDECIAMSARFYNEKHGYTDKSSIAEQYAIHTYFTHFSELELKGGVLTAEGRLAGFSIGERLNSDTFVTHIEKADVRFKGAYTALTHYFTKQFAGDCQYINREEDLGIEGLRKAKESWQPVFLLKKYRCTFAHPEKLI